MLHRRDFVKQLGILLGGILTPFPILSNSRKDKMNNLKQYDVIIVGGSYAGLSAGMALGRALRNVLIIDSGDPANKQTPFSHNFLTNDGKSPNEIAKLAKEQVLTYKSVEFLDAVVTVVTKNAAHFEVIVHAGEKYAAKKLILATGIKDLLPDIPGFADCWGISVLHCPYCHGYEVRNKKTGILANGDVAYELSSLIFNWTEDLTLYTNGKAMLTNEQLGKLMEHKINIVEDKIEKIVHHEGQIKQLIFKNGDKASLEALYARLPFAQHSLLAHNLGCELTPEGYVKIDQVQKTSIEGVYACGDNATRMRTVSNAVAMGTATGLMVNKELIEETF